MPTMVWRIWYHSFIQYITAVMTPSYLPEGSTSWTHTQRVTYTLTDNTNVTVTSALLIRSWLNDCHQTACTYISLSIYETGIMLVIHPPIQLSPRTC